VLHTAGPFSATSEPMLTGCLRAGAHYLDITGEIGVFEACKARDAEARARGVVVMPGVGFDVVPSDCLARALAEALPGAVKLELAFQALGSMSRGTMKTMMEHVGHGVRGAPRWEDRDGAGGLAAADDRVLGQAAHGGGDRLGATCRRRITRRGSATSRCR
jgi:short subunit dehydrogenase-like uncharacterized protein